MPDQQRGSEAWPFDDPPHVAALSTRQVVEQGGPILHVARDEDDGMYQFHTGDAEPRVEDAMLVHLAHFVRADQTLLELADLPPGWAAERDAVGLPWRRYERPADPED